MSPTRIRFVQISDSHLHDAVDFSEFGINPYRSLEAVVKEINHLTPPPRFVVHTGDVVTDETDLAYGHAADILSRLPVPLYCATGNHDDRQLLRKHMAMGPKQDLGGDDGPLCYRFEEGEEQFLVHERLLPARDRLRAVFCGHVHRGTHTNRDGISYITVPSTCSQLAIMPDVSGPEVAAGDPPAFNYITISDNAILAKEYPVSLVEEGE